MPLWERRSGLNSRFKDIRTDTRENALSRADAMARQLYGNTPYRVELTFAEPEVIDDDGTVSLWRFDVSAYEVVSESSG